MALYYDLPPPNSSTTFSFLPVSRCLMTFSSSLNLKEPAVNEKLYFWVSIMFKPVQIADDLKKNGGYVPGVRPGEHTARFLDFVMTRLTLAGAVFLTIIAVFPDFIFKTANVSYNVATFFGGTGMLIIVGVVLDTMRQIETFLLQRHYDGFLRKGRIRGRSTTSNRGIESLELKDFEAQWRPLIIISIALFAFGLLAYFFKGA